MICNTAAEKSTLTDLLAEELLCLGFSISFEQSDGFEFLSATSEAAPGGKLFFLPFDPLVSNASDFLVLVSLINTIPGKTQIVVTGAGERQILQNVLEMQEIPGVEVWRVDKLKDYPLQVI